MDSLNASEVEHYVFVLLHSAMAGRQADIQTDRQIDRQTDKHIDR